MTDLDAEDSLTKLNTQLNKSMVLMDAAPENEMNTPKSNKSIKINTKIQPANTPNASPASRKSILKKTDARNKINSENSRNGAETINNNHNTVTNVQNAPRPQNINDLVKEEELIEDTTDSTFNMDDISDSEDIWIMDIPRTINPEDLKRQTIIFGEKSKFKIKEERYYAVNHNVKCNVTCVFNTGKVKSRSKTVNIKPAGAITVRRKLSGFSNIKPMEIENSSVPFPKNLKTRHPLFGVSYEGKVKKNTIK